MRNENVKYDKKDQQGKAAFDERTQLLHDPATRASCKEPRKTPNKNRTGQKAEHEQVNH
jgi:hypothetical protein